MEWLATNRRRVSGLRGGSGAESYERKAPKGSSKYGAVSGPEGLEFHGFPFDGTIWQWLKIKELGLRGFWSMFPLTRVPFWYRVLEPYPFLVRLHVQIHC